ncbi:MAG TPA: CBS domain-containing protein [Rhizomicrobium sp.]|jgi:CBS domain-containing protein|nr:CBS domain-containing protein [Rhizomicrobium sp.]
MFVEQMLLRACERLAVIDAEASVKDAANLMAEPGTDLIVVCRNGVVSGVVTKSDIVVQISRGSDLGASVDTIMNRDVATCRSSDPLSDVLQAMKERGVHRIPVVDNKHNPVGIVYARDVLQCLLEEVEVDDALLRDFITGVGYR